MAIKNDVGYPSLETERLALRILTLDDCSAVFEHFSDRDVTRFMDIEPCKDLKEAEEIIQFHLTRDAGGGFLKRPVNALLELLGFIICAVKAELQKRKLAMTYRNDIGEMDLWLRL
ncbi:GNAT family N-acetyltransferase [Bacillus sp. EB01]|uniref:GNAT family N-acetyltransferase n=1 Tax=Bacillus sp. EB01 TaxID=1347086 RepID=UPI000B205D16